MRADADRGGLNHGLYEERSTAATDMTELEDADNH